MPSCHACKVALFWGMATSPSVGVETLSRHLRSADGSTYSVPWAESGSGYTASADYPTPREELSIVHSDADIVVVVKPAFLPTENTRHIKDSVHDRVVAALAVQGESFSQLHVAHRLDWETSGLLVLARHADAMRSLSRQFAERTVTKAYTADVLGSPPTPAGRLDLPLAPDSRHPPRQCVDLRGGKPACTRWSVVPTDDAAAAAAAAAPTRCVRLRLQPESGRRHQLRLHMLALGCPIAGDTLYAPAPRNSDRLHLHASELGFAHPASGERLAFSSPPPFEPPPRAEATTLDGTLATAARRCLELIVVLVPNCCVGLRTKGK